MKLLNRQLINSIPPLTQLNGLKLPVKTSFRLAKLSRVVNDALKDYHKTLEGLQDEHAEKDDGGEKVVTDGVIQFKDKEAFQKDLEELLECTVNVSFKKISAGGFGSVEVEPSLLYHLDWLIED